MDIANVAGGVPAANEREASVATAQLDRGFVAEQHLLDYLAGVTNGSYSSGGPSSPAAMSGWIARYFNGFLERASNLKTEIEANGTFGMRHSQHSEAAKSDDDPKLASLPSGPAGRELGVYTTTDAGSGKPVVSSTLNDTLRTLELLLKTSGLMTETTIMTSGVTAVMKSTKQLLSGQ
jgi:hypothetical protein